MIPASISHPRPDREDTAQFRRHTEAFDARVARSGRLLLVLRVALALAAGAATVYWFDASAHDRAARIAAVHQPKEMP